jgi:hypothetical protein
MSVTAAVGLHGGGFCIGLLSPVKAENECTKTPPIQSRQRWLNSKCRPPDHRFYDVPNAGRPAYLERGLELVRCCYSVENGFVSATLLDYRPTWRLDAEHGDAMSGKIGDLKTGFLGLLSEYGQVALDSTFSAER